MIQLVLTLIPLAAPSAAAAHDLPVAVVTPTPTEALGIDELYAVRAGALWVRRGAAAWSLLDGTGVPPGSASPVVAVLADEEDHFTVVTADGFLHHHENGAWDSLWGLPSLPFARAPLALPFPLAELREGRMAYSMRRAHVLFYEDARGAQFHWGDAGTTSLYVLSSDGARIRFGDPWVPPDFSREIESPGFKMAALAASASTIFVIGVDGRMATRFDDYDHNGGTPLFAYDYRADESAPPPSRAGLAGTDPASAAQVRGLPGDAWHAQPAVALAGRARLSRRIAIVQDGTGNHARTLRVVGDDARGQHGVYTKRLDDPAWTFAAREVAVADDAWLDPRADARVPHEAIAYAGLVRSAGHGGVVSASTGDFWFHRSPFHITLDVDGDEVHLVAHAVDAWTLLTQTDPADDDTAYKMLKVTLFLDDADRARPRDPRTRAILDALFRDDLERPFAFAAVANRHELVIVPVGYPWNVARSRWQLVMRADPRERARALVKLRPATRLARTFVDDVVHCASPANAARALAAVRALRADAERRAALSAAVEVALPAGTASADVATLITTTRFTLGVTRWLDFLEQNLPAVLAAPTLATERWLASSRADFDDVERALASCAAR